MNTLILDGGEGKSFHNVCMNAMLLQSCSILCDPVDCTGSSAHGIFQARMVREGSGTPLQYSCLENPMDGRVWWAAVHRVAKSQTRLSDFTFTFHFHALEKEMATHSVFLPGESQGRGSLVGCRLWGRTESDTTEAT